jgi:hypothetical protein
MDTDRYVNENDGKGPYRVNRGRLSYPDSIFWMTGFSRRQGHFSLDKSFPLGVGGDHYLSG